MSAELLCKSVLFLYPRSAKRRSFDDFVMIQCTTAVYSPQSHATKSNARIFAANMTILSPELASLISSNGAENASLAIHRGRGDPIKMDICIFIRRIQRMCKLASAGS